MTINAIYLLLVMMLCIVLSEVIIFEFDYLEPSIIFNSLMTVSCFFASLNIERWGLEIGEDTIIIVSLGMISFAVGDIFIKLKLFSLDLPKTTTEKYVINFSNKKLIICSLIMIVLSLLSFNELYNLSLNLGNTSGVNNMIKVVRYPLERGEVSFSRWQSYRLLISQILAYIGIYAFISNAIISKKYKYRYVLLGFLYIPFTIFTTGRIEILALLIYIWFITAFLYLKNRGYSIKNKNIVLIAAISVGVFFVVIFLIYGTLTGKVISSSRSPFIILSHYLGLSFPALDIFLKAGIIETTTVGADTLSSIINKFSVFGFNIEKTPVFLKFVYFNGIDTNVYSAFRRYISDYGLYGMISILFLFGALFSYCYNHLKYTKVRPASLILFASYYWMLILSFHDEKFLLSGVSTDFIYRSLIIYLLLNTVIIKNEKMEGDIY